MKNKQRGKRIVFSSPISGTLENRISQKLKILFPGSNRIFVLYGYDFKAKTGFLIAFIHVMRCFQQI